MPRDDATFDTIVIGAGIIGSSCAYHLAKSGSKTLLLEQYALNHNMGGSHGGSRICRYTQISPIYLPLIIDAFKQWKELEKSAGEKLFIQNGLIWLDDKPNETLHKSETLKRFSVKHQILKGKQIRQKFPHLHYDDEKWSGVYEPSAGILLADKCLKAIHKQFLANGGQIHDQERVVKISLGSSPSNETEVITEKCTYKAKNIVVASGSWLDTLLPGLPIKVSPQLVGSYFWDIKDNAENFQAKIGSPSLIIDDGEDEIYMLPAVDYKDKIKFGVHLGVDTKNPSIREITAMPDSNVNVARRHIARYLPDIDSRNPSMTSDQTMILDKHPKFSNIFLAGPMAGTGFKFGLTIGKIMTKMVNDEVIEFDLSPFRITRKTALDVKSKI
ncbi:FAD dependent oxidoreductase domain-containing protein [Ditylenchus destructor]|nr:FAD dependent oxidoreductase domain-containing protein [Ditylenchus destructor]